jgi:hypothetical protein
MWLFDYENLRFHDESIPLISLFAREKADFYAKGSDLRVTDINIWVPAELGAWVQSEKRPPMHSTIDRTHLISRSAEIT